MLREKQIGHRVCLGRKNRSHGTLRKKKVGHRVGLERSK